MISGMVGRQCLALLNGLLSCWCQGCQQDTGAAGPCGCGQVTQQEAGEERQQQKGPEKHLVIHWELAMNGRSHWPNLLKTRIFWNHISNISASYESFSGGYCETEMSVTGLSCISRVKALHMHHCRFQPAMPFDSHRRGVGRSALADFGFTNLT